ncbi:hypothetical protein OSTOST_13451, partial [Ostertagia ostertagi]
VTCNRAGEKSRHNFSSMDAARALGGIINRVFGWRPDKNTRRRDQKSRRRKKKPAESSEGALAVSPNEERVRRRRKEERPNDSKKLEDELRMFQKKLTVVRHEIASANYKIDDAWKKSERDPKSLDKLRELKESRRRSREEESELLRKIDKTKERMRKSYEQKERQHGAHRDQSPRPSTSRGGV